MRSPGPATRCPERPISALEGSGRKCHIAGTQSWASPLAGGPGRSAPPSTWWPHLRQVTPDFWDGRGGLPCQEHRLPCGDSKGRDVPGRSPARPGPDRVLGHTGPGTQPPPPPAQPPSPSAQDRPGQEGMELLRITNPYQPHVNISTCVSGPSPRTVPVTTKSYPLGPPFPHL